MPVTYDFIATTTLASTTSDITFSSISAAYTDLRLIVVANDSSTDSSNVLALRFNGITSTQYSSTELKGNGVTPESSRYTNFPYINLSNLAGPSGRWSFYDINIFSYANTSINKSILATNSMDTNGGGVSLFTTGLWRNTAAINSITIFSNNTPTNQLRAGTTATLYGILKA